MNLNLIIGPPPKGAEQYINRSYYHELLKYKLIRMAYNQGFIPIPEANVQRGKLDLLWYKETGEKIIFEIDFSYKPKSLFKLQSTYANKKYWIIVNKQLPLRFFQGIEVIKLPFNFMSSTKMSGIAFGSTAPDR